MGDANDDTVPGESANDDTLVAAPASEPGASTPMPRIRPSRPSLPPTTRDYPALTVVDPAHYVIGRELARGGMGRIQVARDRRLGREVAVKEVLVAAGSIARRFEREARITARLQHPSIISVHEAGTWPSGEPFYAMRLVTGKTLDEALATATTYNERLALLPNVLAIADAMAYAHAEKVIHRDLKPRNVVVGEFGETVVIDWGLAKELGAPDDSLSGSLPPRSVAVAESSPGETTLGEVLGTPAYMPPEQANGESVDERADVYAIGSILYHVLAGSPPFTGDSNAEVIAALHAGPPRRLAEVVPEVATELIAVVERAMARDRDARYPTARALAEDLRRFQTGQLVGAHRYSLRELMRRWLRKHRTALVAVAAATLVALAIGVVAVRRVVAAESDAQAERTNAIAHRADAEALMSFMLIDLRDKLRAVGKLDLIEVVARRAAAYYDAHSATATEEDEFFAGIAQLGIGSVTEDRGDLTNAMVAYTAARARFAHLTAAHPDVTRYRVRELESAFAQADVRNLQGDRPGAVAMYREILPLALANLAAHPDDPDSLHAAYNAHVKLAGDLETLGELPAALAEVRAALEIAERHLKIEGVEKSRKELLNAHALIGRIIYKSKNDAAAALAEYRLALEIGKREVERDPKNPHWQQDVAISHDEVGTILKDQKDLDGALVEYRAALEAVHRAIAVDPTNTEWISTEGTIQEKIGIALFAQKDYPGALAAFRVADGIWLDLVHRDPTNLGWMRGRSMLANKLGDVELATKDPQKAIASYRVALEIREANVVRDPANSEWRRDLFYSHYKLAQAYDALNDDKEVLAQLRAAVAVADVTLAAHPANETFANDAADTHAAIGEALAKIDPATSQTEYRRASEIAHAMAARPNTDPDWTKHAAKYDAKLH